MANHARTKRAAKAHATASHRSKQQIYRVVFDREEDGRWIAEVPALPGVMVYGSSKQEALLRVQALAYRVIADRIEDEKKLQNSVKFASA
jgi:predicted RNase H-like HicB family nuclease